jgi:hypothetical protein
MTVAELESKVVKKTNKYIYFNDGTHTSREDFNELKKNLREKVSISHRDEYKDSMLVYINKLSLLENINNKIKQVNLETDSIDFEKLYEHSNKTNNVLREKALEAARKVYSNGIPIMDTTKEGIKFIIQSTENNEYRLCYDPYQICDNYHSNLSQIFKTEKYRTINGGWITIQNNIVVLDRKSGDYGVFDAQVVEILAAQMFPEYNIICNPGETTNLF